MDTATSLQTAIATSLGIFVVAFVFVTLAWRHLPTDEATRLERARAQGEVIQES
jgi:hypothetical protein